MKFLFGFWKAVYKAPLLAGVYSFIVLLSNEVIFDSSGTSTISLRQVEMYILKSNFVAQESALRLIAIPVGACITASKRGT